VKSLLAKDAYKIVGSGDSILVWEDPWLSNKLGFISIHSNQGAK